MNHILSMLKKCWCPDTRTSIIPLVAMVMLTLLLTRLNSESEPATDMKLAASKTSGSDAILSELPEVVPLMQQAIPEAKTIEISLEEIHRQNNDGFAQAEGFGRHRGGSHVLLGDGAVRFVKDPIRWNQETLSHQSSHSSGQTRGFGLWGSLGAKAKHPTFDEIAKSSLSDAMVSQWEIEQIQLVSVNRFEGPVAYVSVDLPPMDAIEGSMIPTRELNEFETIAIAKIMRGQNIVTNRSDSRMQMVGAIKAKQRCVECHDVKPNALLGAFSYTFALARDE